MHTPPLWIWIAWGTFTGLLLALLAYQGTLTRYEEDQLFLNDNSELQHKENDAVLHKVAQIRPILRICLGLTCVLSAAIVGIYVWEAIRQFYT
jgi:hypothetical protein